jgi:hypothetical protein
MRTAVKPIHFVGMVDPGSREENRMPASGIGKGVRGR